MKNISRYISLVLAFSLAAGLSGCGTGKNTAETSNTNASENETESVQASNDDDEKSTEGIAAGNETIEADTVISDDMMPIEGGEVKDGTYDVEVASSSKMFNIEKCQLTVKDGKMTAVMTMGGKGYEKIYLGTGEEALDAQKENLGTEESDEFIFPKEDSDGKDTFTIDVEYLDKAIDCAALSKRKDKWYDRQLVFKSSSLPSDALSGMYKSAKDLRISDGEYKCNVELTGGSGRASVTSPCKIKVSGEKVTAEIEWSSPNYDYMIVDGKKYYPLNESGNSVFEIPVRGFDYPVPVTADTTAMSQPYEIDYKLNFYSSLVK